MAYGNGNSTSFRIQYLGAIKVKANTAYLASDMASTGANIFILKTRASIDTPITVSINKTIAFPLMYDEHSAFDGTSTLSYIFSQDCIVAVATDLDVV